jgi:hypothetical protein
MTPRMPSLDARRAAEFEAELLARARSWLPEWGIDDDPQDFGRALLAIAARFDSEVAQQLDRAGEKMQRGFVDWLGVRANAARPARMPVVMRMGERAVEPVLARAPVRLQADAEGVSVAFETEGDLRVLPGRLDVVIATDADTDQIFFPPPGLTGVEPVPPAPLQWRVKTFASKNGTALQLDPDAGLSPGMLIAVAGAQYRIEKAEKDIVTIDPRLDADVDAGTLVTKLESFAPFDGVSRDRQQHALYIGHLDLLNIESAATIDVVGAQGLTDVTWKYWGKAAGDAVDGWRELPLSAVQPELLDAVRLVKPIGAVEPRVLGSVGPSRWIAAFAPKVVGVTPRLNVDSIELRINFSDGDSPHLGCPILGDAPENPSAQAMANTTPLVLGGQGVFYPLGKTPRQFDAFYLGSAEAFSKKRADVQLCFGLADPTFAVLSAVRGGASFAELVVAGVAEDRALHLFNVDAATGSLRPRPNRDGLQPPRPGLQGKVYEAPPTVLARSPTWRLPTWWVGDDFLVGVAAGNHVWAWLELANNAPQSGWIDLGALPPGEVVALVGMDMNPFRGLVALQKTGVLSVRIADEGFGGWTQVTPQDTGVDVKLTMIAPALQPIGMRLAPSAICIGIGTVILNNNVRSAPRLYEITSTGACTRLQTDHISDAVQPIAFVDAVGVVHAIAVRDTLDELVWARAATPEVTHALGTVRAVPGSLDVTNVSGAFVVFAVLQDGPTKRLASWSPLVAGSPFGTLPIAPGGEPAGSPTAIGSHLTVPGHAADVLVAPSSLARPPVQGLFGTGVVMTIPTTPLAINDVVVAEIGGVTTLRTITGSARSHGTEAFHPIDDAFGPGQVSREPRVYRYTTTGAVGAAVLNAVSGAVDQLTLAVDDRRVAIGSTLLLQGTAPLPVELVIDALDIGSNPWVATLSGPLPAPNGVAVTYWLPVDADIRIAPFARLDPTNVAERVKATEVERAPIVMATAKPSPQRAQVFAQSASFATLLVFDNDWVAAAPANNATVSFVVDAQVGEWQPLVGTDATNPELSWEYWNGAWSKLDVEDHTANLKTTGALHFLVPPDIAATDWAGKTDFWIRARLVGGDYGTEAVKVRTTPQADGSSVQTIERSPDAIKPPAVVSLAISYAVTSKTLPDFVLAEDSGTVRDRSDANRTPSAEVEAFVPLSVTLGRLQRDAGAAAVDADTASTAGCSGCAAAEATGTAGTAGTAAPVAPATGRALFLGFSSPLDGASVNVLSLVAREIDLGLFAPLEVQALAADRFVPVTMRDGSRALGETGLLTFAFGDAPTRAELFGRALFWVRITPAPTTDGAAWSPELAGLYFNAVWARATETLTRERVGSSEGAPGLTLRLARPPLLDRSLELRVREPLGDEEREALRSTDAARVIGDPDLPGDWVLWTPVNDPADSGPDERVYALDENSGEIRFGDGTHGLIPPIGRDNIVAFSYQRTEPSARGATDVPANAIPPRAQVNLVTPVAGVEAVFSADYAAGGSPTEPDGSVLRNASATLRHRGRALTLRDFEDLALASSPRIAQARALPSAGGVHLVLALSGDSPQPGSAQCRELKRRLLALAPASFGPRSLTITGPRLRPLRVALRLRVDSLERAGAVRDDCAQRLRDCFDPARSVDREGWPIGTRPREQDIARAIDRVAHLNGIAALSLAEALPGGASGPWPAAFRSDELVRLADKDVLVTFDTSPEW